MSIFSKIFGSQNDKEIQKLQPLVERINSYEEDYIKLSSEELKAKTALFKERITKGETIDSLVPEAFALVREMSKRTLGQRHFDVQFLGGLILHQGGIPEMRTGEGKTLVATLPVYTQALAGLGVHVVTVNDYLSRRDASWMGQIYDALGLSVGVINHDESFLYDSTHVEKDTERDQVGSFKVVNEFLRPCTRKEAYAADITYGTNNEFGFDFLRDNIEYETARLRQRGHHFAIVDEVDSILIDEARTPLIISAPSSDSGELYARFADIASKLSPETDYTVDEKYKSISLTDAGITHAEKLLGVENIYTEKGIKYVHHLETAVKARALFINDKEYVVKDDEIIIVDEFTGRLQPGRRWSEGLHQAIEAKEKVSIQKESKTFASITFQNYFRLYTRLSGMTGTARTSSEEFFKVYGLHVVSVPTNKPVARIDKNDLIFKTEIGKFKAIAREVKERWQKGQPVLVGTVSIERNELLSEFLKAEGIPHELLNAKNHAREGEIIAQAGKKGSVTIATNLAGRGVDVKLGGNPSTHEESEKVKELGGLFVLGTERHDARRIDNQLRGRSGRQGDPGETQFFVSLEDTLMRVFGGDRLKSMMTKLGVPDDEAIENSFITRSIEQAQEKIEGFNFDARKHVLEFDDVLNYQRKIFYERRNKVLTGGVDAVGEFVEPLLHKLTEEDRKAITEKLGSDKEAVLGVVRQIVLQTMDMYWVEHLEVMDYMRSSVNLRAYGQRDPLTEYKREGLRLFKEMEVSIENQILKLIPEIQPQTLFAQETTPELRETREGAEALTTEKQVSADGVADMVGRNDPCPCGAVNPETGEVYKYKKCGMINAPHHKK
ncbi:MAG: preprotein translocase subunit SecA [Candidatus Zambryskibacteria bacterium]|nr:preprotein translocase subunit SecA [Candidatus Zambryskibacteria bacterium]